MSARDPRGTVFRPKYRLVLWFGLAMSTLTSALVAAVAIVLHAHWGIVTVFLLMPPVAVATLLWTVLYRSIEFGDDALRLGRYLFSDVEMPYCAVDDVSSVGLRSDGRAVSWKLMRNGEELEARVEALREQGVIADDQLSGEMEADAAANRMASAIVVGVVSGGLAAFGVSSDLNVLSWPVLLPVFVGSLVAMPVLAKLLRDDTDGPV